MAFWGAHMKRGTGVFVFLRPLFSLCVGKTPRGEVRRWGITSRVKVGETRSGSRTVGCVNDCHWGCDSRPSRQWVSLKQKAPPVKAGPSAYPLCYCIPHETRHANLALGPSPIRGYPYGRIAATGGTVHGLEEIPAPLASGDRDQHVG